MYKNLKVFCNLAIIFILAVGLSQAGVSVSSAAGYENTYRDDSSPVFSPGYLNAAKYKADSIAKQQATKKSVLDNMVSYVQKNLANKVQDSADDKPKIELKKKASNPTGKGTATPAATAISSSGSTTVPPYVTKKIQDYLSGAEVVGNTDYIIKKSGNKYLAFWDNNASDYIEGGITGMKCQAFDSGGNTIEGFGPVMLSTDSVSRYASMDTVAVLVNGNVAVFYTEEDLDTGNFYNLMQVVDQNGNETTESPVVLNGETAPYYSYINSYSVLDNGNIAVFTVEQGWDDTWSSSIYMLDSAGNLLDTPPTLLTNDGMGVVVEGFTTLANGNMAAIVESENEDGNWSCKLQLLDSSGAVLDTPAVALTGDSEVIDEFIENVTTMDNGNVAVIVSGQDADENWTKCKIVMLDGDGNIAPSGPAELSVDGTFNGLRVGNVMALDDGGMAVFWDEVDLDGNWKCKTQIFDSEGSRTGDSPVVLTEDRILSGAYMERVTELDNGEMAVFWDEQSAGGDWFCKAKILNSTLSEAETSLIDITPGEHLTNLWINDVVVLDSGEIAVFWEGKRGDYNFFNSQVIDRSGNLLTSDALSAPVTNTNTVNSSETGLTYTPPMNPFSTGGLSEMYAYFTSTNANSQFNAANLSGALKAAINNTEAIAQNLAPKGESEAGENAIKNTLKESALGIYVPKYVSAADVEATARLLSIVRDPNEDQRAVLDVIKSLLSETSKMDGKDGAHGNDELKKAEENLLNMVANVLLAQGIPDLIKKGDMANIRAIFSELDSSKNRIMLEYNKSTRPYYDNMLRDLAKNLAILQSKNILNPNMTKDQLSKMPPSELDKILEKIKNMKDRGFEEEYLLQQESKYRKDYIEPNKQKLEKDMKDMMKDFTGRIQNSLKNTEKK